LKTLALVVVLAILTTGCSNLEQRAEKRAQYLAKVSTEARAVCDSLGHVDVQSNDFDSCYLAEFNYIYDRDIRENARRRASIAAGLRSISNSAKARRPLCLKSATVC